MKQVIIRGERMSQDYVLMCRNEKILGFEYTFHKITVFSQELLPFGLRHDTSAIALFRWLSNRATPLSRKNVDFMYMLLKLPRSEIGKAELAQQYGGVSINDSFWIKQAHETANWRDVSPFAHNSGWSAHDRAFGYDMLSGSRSAQQRPNRFSPETTLQGNWSKCLERRVDGIYLYKANDGDPREVEASEFGSRLGLDVVRYWQEDYEDVPCTVCKIESNEYRQWFFAEEIGEIAAANKFPRQYATMRTFDYIVGNADRHSMNWGWVTNSRMTPQKLTPMFDFNFALQNVRMEIPQGIDKALVKKAENLLAADTTIPNRAYYLARIDTLCGK